MATSGNFTGARGGTGTGPYLTLYWSRIEVDTPNNRSKIRLSLYLNSDYSLNFSASKTGNLYGTAFTYTGGFSGTGWRTLKEIDVWVTHDSVGDAAIYFDATFNISISWGGYNVSSLSVGGWAYIDRIPRASDFTAFTLDNTWMMTDYSTNVIRYTVSKKSSSFSHDYTLVFGGKTIASWSDSGDGARTRALSAAETNAIIAAMPNAADGYVYLNMQTKSGSTNIGSPGTRSVYVGLDSRVKPSVSGLVASIFGTGRDKTIGKYIQNMSKITASFSAGAGYGASISYSQIVIRRQSDKADSQTISGTSGTTTNPVKLSGTYDIIAEVGDSRGRYNNMIITVTVDAYSPPTISKFSASRGTPSTTVNSAFAFSWSNLGTGNPATITMVGVNNVGTATTWYTLTNSTAGAVDTTANPTAQSDASSYTYTLTVTDSFGNKATAVVTIGTSFVEMSISKGKGVGIGKVHEFGSLDVAGDIYQDGKKVALQAYPVGAIYISVSSTNPGSIFGGTWTAFGTGRTLVGIDTADTSFNTVEKTGGAKTHKLTESELANHKHNLFWYDSYAATSGAYYTTAGIREGYATGTGRTIWGNGQYAVGVGGDQPHNNLQPYITVYMWKRTA